MASTLAEDIAESLKTLDTRIAMICDEIKLPWLDHSRRVLKIDELSRLADLRESVVKFDARVKIERDVLLERVRRACISFDEVTP